MHEVLCSSGCPQPLYAASEDQAAETAAPAEEKARHSERSKESPAGQGAAGLEMSRCARHDGLRGDFSIVHDRHRERCLRWTPGNRSLE
jgi:hypothetical protein